MRIKLSKSPSGQYLMTVTDAVLMDAETKEQATEAARAIVDRGYGVRGRDALEGFLDSKEFADLG